MPIKSSQELVNNAMQEIRTVSASEALMDDTPGGGISNS